MFTFENKSPTEIEEKMFCYNGYYLIERTEDNLLYAICHVERDKLTSFPTEINIDREKIDFDSTIEFSLLCEMIKINGWIDNIMLNLIAERTKELGFRVPEVRYNSYLVK